jgi:broad specificity phosphatase PhoE
MAKLFLIKHAAPVKDPNKPAHDWQLSDLGKDAAARLAELLADQKIDVIVTSDEPKARETGEILARILGCPIEQAADLHEHDRSNVPVMPTRDFISSMAQFFKEPDRLVLGRESASEAQKRFADALEHVLQSHEQKNIAVVSHGTVLALWVANQSGQDPFQLWRTMGLPSFVEIDWPGREVVRVVQSV